MPTRRFFRTIWLPLYRRWALRQMQRENRITMAGIRLSVPPGVFHPGLFFSTPIFLSFLQKVDFQNKKILDVGTGSGILAIFTAKNGGIATASDIHPMAVATARLNAAANAIPVEVLESDLFDQLARQSFDIVLVNPPYYPRNAGNFAERAFFAGENLGYFEKLFAGLPAFIHPATRIWMILSEDCELEKIAGIAALHGLGFEAIFSQKKWGERFYVFQLQA